MSPVESKNPAWQENILKVLDQAVADYEFPIFDNTNYPAAIMRITVFRDSAEWLLLFERVVYAPQEARFLNMVSAFGNKLSAQGYQTSFDVIEESIFDDIWNDEYEFQLDLMKFTLLVKEEVREFTLSPEDYEKAGVDLAAKSAPELKLLYLLSSLIGEELLMTDEELLNSCKRSNIPRLLQLVNWHHPAIFDDELPSQTACFENLARAIALDDPKLYSCPEPINSHWSHWS